MTRNPRRYPVLAGWLLAQAAIELAWGVGVAWARVRRVRPVCAVLGHAWEPREPWTCIRCDTTPDPVKHAARTTEVGPLSNPVPDQEVVR